MMLNFIVERSYYYYNKKFEVGVLNCSTSALIIYCSHIILYTCNKNNFQL